MIQVKIDVPMPDFCGRCPFCYDYMYCEARDISIAGNDDWIMKKRPDWCPLEEVEQ